MVKDINTGGSSYAFFLKDVSGMLFFAADDGASGHVLWKTNSGPRTIALAFAASSVT